MDNLLRKSGWALIILAILIVAGGVFLIIKPDTSLETAIKTLGIFLAASGLMMSVVFYRKVKQGKGFWFSEGVFNILAGLFIIFFPELLIRIVFILFGIWVVVIGLVFLMIFFNLDKKLFYIVSGIILLIGGFALVFNPLESAELTMQLIGVILVISGIFAFISGMNLRKFIKTNAVEAVEILED